MDTLDKKLTLPVQNDGKTYTFKRPIAKQLIQADVLAANMRGNTPVSALRWSVSTSDMVATLNVCVIEPAKFDFGDLYDTQVSEIYAEVVEWINSFRAPVSPT